MTIPMPTVFSANGRCARRWPGGERCEVHAVSLPFADALSAMRSLKGLGQHICIRAQRGR
jgi:hypothetical protein